MQFKNARQRLNKATIQNQMERCENIFISETMLYMNGHCIVLCKGCVVCQSKIQDGHYDRRKVFNKNDYCMALLHKQVFHVYSLIFNFIIMIISQVNNTGVCEHLVLKPFIIKSNLEL